MKTYTVEIDHEGNKRWYNPGTDDLHREDGPAVVYADGSEFWFRNGLAHRTDGPAVVWADGSKYWCQNGQYHRVDGPAIECADGTKIWMQYGEINRFYGPAVEGADGRVSYFISGLQLTKERFDIITSLLPFI